MTNNKQEMPLEWLESQLLKQKSILKNHFEKGNWNDDRCSEIDNCLLFIQQAKEMEKERMIEFAREVLMEAYATFEGNVTTELTIEQYYERTQGGDK